MCRRFNSRARGGRDARKEFEDYIQTVSIHAPAGGATAGLSEVEKQADTMLFLRCEQTRNSILVVLDLFGVLIA